MFVLILPFILVFSTIAIRNLDIGDQEDGNEPFSPYTKFDTNYYTDPDENDIMNGGVFSLCVFMEPTSIRWDTVTFYFLDEKHRVIEEYPPFHDDDEHFSQSEDYGIDDQDFLIFRNNTNPIYYDPDDLDNDNKKLLNNEFTADSIISLENIGLLIHDVDRDSLISIGDYIYIYRDQDSDGNNELPYMFDIYFRVEPDITLACTLIST